jgi:hypothetical protein
MKDELQSKLVEVLAGISEGVAQAKDFAVEQLPDVAQQYIMFGMVWETAVLLALMAASAALATAAVWGLRRASSREAKWSEKETGGWVAAFAVLILLFVGVKTFAQMKPVLLVWFAPKLYLIQGIAGLIK